MPYDIHIESSSANDNNTIPMFLLIKMLAHNALKVTVIETNIAYLSITICKIPM